MPFTILSVSCEQHIYEWPRKSVCYFGMEQSKGRVCVTGGTGFIGSWIIKRLLEDGYSVNTTVRTHPGQNKDVSFLTNLPRASQKLQILNADLSNPESFGAAIEGCIGVFHVATPVDFQEREPEEIVTKRSIDGALGILRACKNSKTVKRVVYTSSASAVTFSSGDDDGRDESFWTDVDSLKALKRFGWSYAVSKTLTEKAVLEFAEQNGLDVVTLIPTFVLGPFICPKLPGSVRSSLALLFGDDQFGYILQTPVVHVDDVARAHTFLLEHPNPKGRYNCSSCLVTRERMAEVLSSKYPEFQMSTADLSKEITDCKFADISSKKLIDAGFEYKYELEQMVDDAIRCCKEKGFL